MILCLMSEFLTPQPTGEMNVLHPLELVRQIRKISQNPVVGTDVTIVPIVHPTLSLGRHVSSQGLSRVEKVLGSVHKDTDFSFTFGVREKNRGKDVGVGVAIFF